MNRQFPLASGQEDIYFDQLLHPGTAVYNIGGYVRIEGDVDVEQFQRTIAQLVEESEALRLRFTESDGRPFQEIVPLPDYRLPIHDCGLDACLADIGLSLRTPFEDGGPLFDFALYRVGSGCSVWRLKFHHLVIDGWGIAGLIRRAGEIYTALGCGGAVARRETRSFREFAEEDWAYRISEEFRNSRTWWLARMPEIPEPLLPRDRVSGETGTTPGIRRTLRLSRYRYDETMARLKQAGSPFHFFTALLAVYFARVCRRRELVFGAPILNRRGAFKATTGCFTAMSPVVVPFNPDQTFPELMRAVQREMRAALRHQRFPIGQLKRELGITGQDGRRLFDIALSYERHDYVARFGAFESEAIKVPSLLDQNPLSIYVDEFDSRRDVEVHFDCNLACMGVADAERFVAHIDALWDEVMGNPSAGVGSLELVTGAGRREQLEQFNSTTMEFPRGRTLTEEFGDQVQRARDRIAVEDGHSALSYTELDRRAGAVAARLIAAGLARRRDAIALRMNRSVEAIVGILGILKAGCPYLPIDPRTPAERVRTVLADSNAQALFTDSSQFYDADLAIPILHAACGESSGAPRVDCSPEDLAYLLYTSGSTGTPKGVSISHRSVLNLVAGLEHEVYRLHEGPLKVGLCASLVFDASVQQIFACLLGGHTLSVIPAEAARDGVLLHRYLAERAIEISDGTPSLLFTLLEAGAARGELAHLKHLIIGGEALSPALVDRFFATYPECRITNVYGLSECAVDSTAFHLDARTGIGLASIPIGKPLPNTQVYVLDNGLRLLPIGAEGEICISGEGLAAGYRNDPDLTAQRFVDHPFRPGGRLFRTGDLGRWRADGNLEFRGRMDRQVKVRGYRVELGEIEHRLSTFPPVRQAAAETVLRGGFHEIVAYFTGAGADEIPALREHLAAALPEWMLPSHFVPLESFPRNASGKIDRRALPAPTHAPAPPSDRAQPESALERAIAAIWCEVLEIVDIGAGDNFFTLGGHSLKAAQILSRLRHRHGIELGLRDLLSSPTVRQLARLARAQDSGNVWEIPSAPPLATYELSSAQKRLWILHQLNPTTSTYHMCGAFHAEPAISAAGLRENFEAVWRRHEILRTVICVVDGEPRQKILDDVPCPFAVLDFCREDDPVARSIEWAQREALRPFDLETGPLVHLTYINTADDCAVVVIRMHHLVSDAWSIPVLLGELFRGCSSEPLGIQYKDFAQWQNDALRKSDWLRRYWGETLPEAPPRLELPTDASRPMVKRNLGGRLRAPIPAGLQKQLSSFARDRSVSHFAVLLAISKALLARYTGAEEITVGVPAAGRVHPALENQIGLFVNMLVVCTRVPAPLSFEEAVLSVHRRLADALDHQAYPFDALVDDLGAPRDTGRNPLFDVSINLIEEQPIPATPLWTGPESSKFDLTLEFHRNSSDLSLEIEYDIDLFRHERVERLAAHWIQFGEAALEHPNRAVGEVPYLSSAEREQVLEGFNATAWPGPHFSNLVDAFQNQAERNPTALALCFRNARLTYGELNRSANRVANHLRSRLGLRPEEAVGILFERLDLALVGIWAVLKAGGAYLPLDPQGPADRWRSMLDDAGARVILSESSLAALCSECAIVLSLDDDFAAGQSGENLDVEIGPDRLAYGLFTSGSTGRPKGSLIEHGSVLNLVLGLNRCVYAHHTGPLRVAMIASLVFDASVQQIFAALLGGHSLFIPETQAKRDGRLLMEFYRDNGIQLSDGTPSLLYSLVAVAPEDVAPVEHFVIGGEALTGELVQSFRATPWGRHARLTNIYGLTECCVDSLYYPVPEVFTGSSVPVGYPMANMRAYILDSALEPQPVGVDGEIFLAGPGLGRGYRNRGDEEKLRWVPDVFHPGRQMFRTGDWGRWSSDGAVIFVGRKDGQVKIRGHRIELGEIEAALGSHPSVRRAVVQAVDGDLAAYCVLSGEVSSRELRGFLSRSLPSYMVPSHVIVLEELPLNASGKVDRRALPKPARGLVTEGRVPGNDCERRISEEFAEVLKASEFSLEDSFFELGGHSLAAVRLVSRLRDRHGLQVQLGDIFAAPSVAGLARRIDGRLRADAVRIPRVPRAARHPLSHAQRRMWVMQQIDSESTVYNIVGGGIFHGTLVESALEHAFSALIQRHEMLRTRFVVEDGEPRQAIEPSIAFALERTSAGAASLETALSELAAREAASPFALDQAPLFRAVLVRADAETHGLILAVHHMIVDADSLRILRADLSRLYAAARRGAEADLAPLSCQYVDYVAWHRSVLAEPETAALRDYWRGKLRGPIEPLNLPVDYARPLVFEPAGASLRLTLPETTRIGLQAIAAEHDATFYMVFSALVKCILHRWTGQTDVVTGSPVSERDHAELESQVGLYLNTLPFRDTIRGADTFLEALSAVRQTAIEAYRARTVPFDVLIDDLDLPFDQSRHPLFDVLIAQQDSEALWESVSKVDFDSGLQLSLRDVGVATAKFDLAFTVWNGEHCEIRIDYPGALFRPQTIDRLASHLLNLAAGVVEDSTRTIQAYELLSPEERSRIEAFSRGPIAEADRRTILECFEEQVRLTPDAPAVEYGNRTWTYRKLDEIGGGIGSHLRARFGIGRGDIVALLVTPSEWTAVAIFGILHCGAAFVPIAADFPPGRILKLLELCGASAILTIEADAPDFAVSIPVVMLDAVDWSTEAAVPTRLTGSPSDLAYVLFTSGSTGEPKAVQIEHRSVVNLVAGLRHLVYDHHPPARRVSLMAAYVFDASVQQIFGALLGGHLLCIAPSEVKRDGRLLSGFLSQKAIDISDGTPSLLEVLLSAGEKLPAVQQWIIGGEPLSADLVRRFYAASGTSGSIVNIYGLAECAVDSLAYAVESAPPSGESLVPIGCPMLNQSAWVLDENLQLCPIGVRGTVYLGGPGVGRGYLGRPELSAEVFVRHPSITEGSLCRTGDLGYWRADGNLVLLGRVDRQIKIRGHRIEPVEVEAALARYPSVVQAHAGVWDAGSGSELVAWFVSHQPTDSSELRAFLWDILPHYMVPSHFIPVEQFPLTRSGKIDASALPAPALQHNGASPLVPPRTHLERRLASIWEEVLKRRPIGIHENFFDMGGHSLTAAHLVARIYQDLELNVAVRDVYDSASIAKLADLLAARRQSAWPSIPRAPIAETFPLSHAQRGVWIAGELNPEHFWNRTSAVLIEGDLDIAALQSAFDHLLARHESLRSSVRFAGTEPMQHVAAGAELRIVKRDLSSTPDPHAAARTLVQDERGTAIDIGRAPLCRAQLLHLNAQTRVLVLTIHHLICDGWSIQILSQELVHLYQTFATGQAPALPPIRLQYRDFSTWHNALLASPEAEPLRDYWQSRIARLGSRATLPYDRARRPAAVRNSGWWEHAVPDRLTAGLKALARERRAPVFPILAAGVHTLLHLYTGAEEIAIGTVMAGRAHPDLHDQIGLYVNTVVLTSRIRTEQSRAGFLDEVRKTAMEAEEHQLYPFDLLVAEFQRGKRRGRQPLVDVLLVFQEEAPRFDLGTLRIGPYVETRDASGFDCVFHFAGTGEGLQLRIEYDANLFDAVTVERLTKHLMAILGQFEQSPGEPMGNLRLDEKIADAMVHGAGN